MASKTWRKDDTGFTQLPCALEYPLHEQHGYLTPNEHFFVCSAGATPLVDAARWRLRIVGDGIERALELDYEALRALPQTTVPAFLECAGNHRRLFQDVLGERLDKRPHMEEILWRLGGVGMAQWSGVALRDVLTRAGVKSDVVHVCPVGLDRGIEGEDGVQVPLPLYKALDPHTLIAIEMNGAPLPPDHGFPARLIVPGWVGTYSIKWLDRIVVSMRHLWVSRNTEQYVMRGESWPEAHYAPARGAPVTEQSIKSSLALPWPAKLERGWHTIRGYARSPSTRIRSVRWSDDGGERWQEAQLVAPNREYAWVQFAFEWEAVPGQHTLMTRASDESGRTQPDRVPFNICGYLFNMVHPHPVVVS